MFLPSEFGPNQKAVGHALRTRGPSFHILIQKELLLKALRPSTHKTHPSLITKHISKNNAPSYRSERKAYWEQSGRGRSMTRSRNGKELADLEKSCRKVIFNPRLENNFTFSQISLKNLLLSEPGRFIQINGLQSKISLCLDY